MNRSVGIEISRRLIVKVSMGPAPRFRSLGVG
jgi:hypothetical protein